MEELKTQLVEDLKKLGEEPHHLAKVPKLLLMLELKVGKSELLEQYQKQYQDLQKLQEISNENTEAVKKINEKEEKKEEVKEEGVREVEFTQDGKIYIKKYNAKGDSLGCKEK